MKQVKQTKQAKPDSVVIDTKAGDDLALVLQADIQAATKYSIAVLSADSIIENAERDFCKSFSTNHEGALKPAIKQAFAKLKLSGVFEGLAKQSIDNLSSAAQWIAAQPYNAQDAVFEAPYFRKAYQSARWPTTSGTPTTSAHNEPTTDKIEAVKVTPSPAQEMTFDGACNTIAMELNCVIEDIATVINNYPKESKNYILEVLAADIAAAVEKAAHARLHPAANVVALKA